MIDIHTHILPGLDDGAASVGDAMDMARIAVNQGITHMIATPHHADGSYINEAAAINQAVEALQYELKQNGIPLTLSAGQEIRLHKGMLDDLEKGKLLTLNQSRYVLLEFPPDGIPSYTDEYMHELIIAGIVPIIAHPERNAEIANDPDKLQNLIDQGALSQITAGSLNGNFGRKLRNVALELIKRNLVHLIASDAHNTGSRGFALAQAYEVIEQSMGQWQKQYYLENARNLYHNKDIIRQNPTNVHKKWYKIW